MSDTLEATKRELEGAGIAYTVELGRRHYKVRFIVRGEAPDGDLLPDGLRPPRGPQRPPSGPAGNPPCA